jgi:citrate synthase
VQRLLRELTPAADPMALLRTAVSALALEPTTPATDISIHGPALDLIAQMPALVAAIHRLGRGEKPLTRDGVWAWPRTSSSCSEERKPARELARSVEVWVDPSGRQ